jgi:hypothetical protein
VAFGSPPEFSGVHRPTALAVCVPPARACGSGRLSWGLAPLRRLRSGCPFCRDRRGPIVGGEGCHALAGAALGLSQPLGGFSRVARSSPSCPEPARNVACPGTPRPCSMPLTSLGFSLQSLPLSRSRAAFRRPSASLRVRRRPLVPTRRDRGSRDRFPPCAAALPRLRFPRGALRDATPGAGHDFPAIVEAACPSRESPRTTTSTAARFLRARRLTAASPASTLCSPRESVHAATVRKLELAPEPHATTGPLLSWDSALLELSPPRPRVRSTASPPGEPDVPGRPRPLRTAEHGASILRPRPSGSGGRDQMAIRSLRRQTLRASAPPYGGAPSSLALGRPRTLPFVTGWTSED